MSVVKPAAATHGAVCITSLYPKFKGSHFGLPPTSRSVHKMTGLGGKIVGTMTYADGLHSSWCPSSPLALFRFQSFGKCSARLLKKDFEECCCGTQVQLCDRYPVSNIDNPVRISNEPVRAGGPVRLSNESVRNDKNLQPGAVKLVL